MAIGDILRGLGTGLERGLAATGEVAKSVLQPVGDAFTGEGAARNARAWDQYHARQQVLTASIEQALQTERDPARRTALEQQLIALYPAPASAQGKSLTQRLHQIVHPQGAVAGTPAPMQEAQGAQSPGQLAQMLGNAPPPAAAEPKGTVHQLDDGSLVLVHPDGTVTPAMIGGQPVKGKPATEKTPGLMEPEEKGGLFLGVTDKTDPLHPKRYSIEQLKNSTAPPEAVAIYHDYQTQEREKNAEAEKKLREREAMQTDRMVRGLQIALEKGDYLAAQKEVNKAKEDYRGGVQRLKTMQDNLQAGLKGDQQAMLSLTANHIGMTLGAQKGARITRAVWDEATESAPWLSRVTARWTPDGYLSGVVLTPDQMHQMVHLGQEKVKILGENVADVQNDYGEALQVKQQSGDGGKGAGKGVGGVLPKDKAVHDPLGLY